MAINRPNKATKEHNPLDILVIHGPNLNLLGRREPDIYGHETIEDIEKMLRSIAERRGIQLNTFQSNHEGAIIDRIHQAMDETEGLIINPGGYTHTSVAIRDALAMFPHPIVEVHMTNIASREDFRKESLISPMVDGVISGFGMDSYRLALLWLMRNLE